MATPTNNLMEFERIHKSIMDSRIAWESGKLRPNKPQSYTDLWRDMNHFRFFLLNEYNNNLSDFREMENLYNTAVLEREKARFDDEYKKLTAVVVSIFRKMVKELTAAKHQQVINMVRTPPTESMAMLLKTLEMRDDLDATEAYDILPLFYENYAALRALQSIGRKFGIEINAPVQLDALFMHQTIDNAATYLYGACDELLKPKGKSMHYADFFFVNDDEKDKIYAPMFQEFVDVLDSVPQLQDFSANKTSLTPLEQAKIDWYYRDVPKNADKTQLAQYTKDVMERYPKDIALLKLSKYSEFVEIVQEAAK